MLLDQLQNSLLRAGKSAPPPEARVPYGFETRIMARVRELTTADPWEVRGWVLWRSALVACLVMAAVLGANFATGTLDDAGAESEAAVEAFLAAHGGASPDIPDQESW
jgi:hypothetical protein